VYMNSITALARVQYEHSVHELVGWDGIGLRGSGPPSCPKSWNFMRMVALTTTLQVATLAHSSHVCSRRTRNKCRED